MSKFATSFNFFKINSCIVKESEDSLNKILVLTKNRKIHPTDWKSNWSKNHQIRTKQLHENQAKYTWYDLEMGNQTKALFHYKTMGEFHNFVVVAGEEWPGMGRCVIWMEPTLADGDNDDSSGWRRRWHWRTEAEIALQTETAMAERWNRFKEGVVVEGTSILAQRGKTGIILFGVVGIRRLPIGEGVGGRRGLQQCCVRWVQRKSGEVQVIAEEWVDVC